MKSFRLHPLCLIERGGGGGEGGGVPYGKKWRISSLWYVGDNFRLSTKEEEEQLSIIIRDEHTKWKLETSNSISPFPLIEYNKQQQPSTCFFFFF